MAPPRDHVFLYCHIVSRKFEVLVPRNEYPSIETFNLCGGRHQKYITPIMIIFSVCFFLFFSLSNICFVCKTKVTERRFLYGSNACFY